jgi:hypothetical protein
MRTDDAVTLAKLVQSISGATITDASVDSLMASWSETRIIYLPVEVTVRVVYELAEVRGDSLFLHPDIYGLRRGDAEAAALRVLAATAHDTSRVDRAALRLLLRRARSEHVRSPIARFLSTDSLAPGANSRKIKRGVRAFADGRPGEVAAVREAEERIC